MFNPMNNSIIKNDLEEIYQQKVNWTELDGKTIMVTGAYGMLATYVIYMLLYLVLEKKLNISIIALGKSKEKFEKTYGDELKRYIQFVESDLLTLPQICCDVDYIIHAASLASPQYYEVCPVNVLEPNVIGNYNLLKLAAEKNVKSYLLFSSCDVYGKVESVKSITEKNYGIMDTLDIHNCYSESKRMAETMCKAFLQQYNVPIKIARIAHTYAPTMDIENDPRVFASFVKNIVNNQDIVIKSDGNGKRSFCYISDAVTGYFKILLEGKNGEAYNVCNSSQYMSVSQLADKLISLYPEKNLRVVKKQRNKQEIYLENNLLEGVNATPSESKLKMLGWTPFVPVEEGFQRVIDFLLKEAI